MITCTLNGKKYTVDYVPARVFREMEDALKMLGRINQMADALTRGEKVEENTGIAEAMDVFAKWFCVLFANQFTVDDVYDHYPSDRFMADVSLAIMAVQTKATEVLSEFPTKAATERKAPQKKK